VPTPVEDIGHPGGLMLSADIHEVGPYKRERISGYPGCRGQNPWISSGRVIQGCLYFQTRHPGGCGTRKKEFQPKSTSWSKALTSLEED